MHNFHALASLGAIMCKRLCEDVTIITVWLSDICHHYQDFLKKNGMLVQSHLIYDCPLETDNVVHWNI